MRVYFMRDGIFVHLLRPKAGRRAWGFVIKPKSKRLFSERYTNNWIGAFTLGPLYFRTYGRRDNAA